MFVEIGECAIILSLTFYRTVSALTRTVSWLASKNDVARIVLASSLRNRKCKVRQLQSVLKIHTPPKEFSPFRPFRESNTGTQGI